MTIGHEQPITERLSYPSARPARKSSAASAWLLVGLSLALTGAFGYYAFTLRNELDVSARALGSAEANAVKQRARAEQLVQQNEAAQREHAQREALFSETTHKLESASAELAAAQTRLDELDAERGAMNEQLAEFKQMTSELKRMIDSGRLKVSFRRGRMIVELPAQVLFASGSADLTDDGKEALVQVAKSLRGFKSRHFIVAGHTDNVPVSGRFASNWELSSARAVTVTGALIRGGLQPEQLVAAGYGEFDPVARNATDAGKQKNRRIEIILEPRLRELKPAK